MKPVAFAQSNGVLRAPEGMADCVDLPVHKANGWISSVWELEPGEITELIVSRRLVLHVQGRETHPPVGLEVLQVPREQPVPVIVVPSGPAAGN